MPQLPEYNSPQVAPQSAPAVTMRTPPPGAFGEGLGQGMQNLGASMEQVAERAQHEANVTRVEDAANQLRDSQMQLENFVRSQKGKNAFDPKAFGGEDGQSLDQQTLSAFDASAEGIASGLAGPRQKQMFKEATDRFRLDLLGKVNDHLAQQDQVVKVDTLHGTTAAEQQNVGLNGYVNGKLDEPTVQQSLGRTNAAIDTFYTSQGLDPTPHKLEAATRIYGTVISQMMRARNADGAKTYFQVHEKEMDPALVGGLRKQIDDTSLSIQVLKDVDKVVATGAGMEEQFQKLEQMYAGNPEGLKEARMELHNRITIRKQSVAFSKQDAEGKLWDMFHPTVPGQQRQDMATIKQSPEWRSLNGEDRNILQAKWEAFGKRNASDPMTVVREAAAFYDALRVPGPDGQPAWLGYNSSQVKALTGDIGPQNAIALLGMVYQHQTAAPGAPKPVTIDTGVVESTLRSAGILKDPKLSADDKALVMDLESKLKTEFYGKPQPGPIELRNRINELTKPIVTKPENWLQRFIPGDWSDKAPLFQAEQADPFTPQFYLQASDMLMQKGGSQMSEADAQQLYLAYKNAGKLDAQGNIVGYTPNPGNILKITRAPQPSAPQKLPKATARRK